MKRQFFLFVMMTIVGTATVSAQQPAANKAPQMRNMPQQRQATFAKPNMADVLSLDDQTAAKFNETNARYQKEMKELMQKYAPAKKAENADKKEAKAVTDEQIKKNIEDGFAKSRAMLDLREKYYKEFSTFLNARQLQRLYKMQSMPMGQMRGGFNQMRRGNMPQMGRPGFGQQQRPGFGQMRNLPARNNMMRRPNDAKKGQQLKKSDDSKAKTSSEKKEKQTKSKEKKD